jgi:hypothetical protein
MPKRISIMLHLTIEELERRYRGATTRIFALRKVWSQYTKRLDILKD